MTAVEGARFAEKHLPERPDYEAPDGSAVRLLCEVERAGMAHFELAPGRVTQAVVHRTVDEIWFVVAGTGRMWRQRDDGAEQELDLQPGLCLTIPVGTSFQFTTVGPAPLQVIAVTTPRWPGPAEAVAVDGRWPPAG